MAPVSSAHMARSSASIGLIVAILTTRASIPSRASISAAFNARATSTPQATSVTSRPCVAHHVRRGEAERKDGAGMGLAEKIRAGAAGHLGTRRGGGGMGFRHAAGPLAEGLGQRIAGRADQLGCGFSLSHR